MTYKIGLDQSGKGSIQSSWLAFEITFLEEVEVVIWYESLYFLIFID